MLWVSAATPEALASGFVALAALLSLPEADAKDQALAVAAVKRWLEANHDWLLVLDNANDLSELREFGLPALKGHMLLTTQANALGGLARPVEIEEMKSEEGATFLLRRVGLLGENEPLEAAVSEDANLARSVSDDLGGLPLALDQAGAYLEETGCGLERYRDLYRRQGEELRKRRGGIAPDHASVAATFALSFANVAQAIDPAAEILLLCAFLNPEAILEQILTEGAPDLGTILAPVAADPLKLNLALSAALRYSLLRRSARMLNMHRLVQQVIRDGMAEFEKALGPDHPNVARSLNNLALLYDTHGKYAEAEPLYKRSLAIRETALGPDHPNVATALENYADLLRKTGRRRQAAEMDARAKVIRARHALQNPA